MTFKSEDIEFLKTMTPDRINQNSDPPVIYHLIGIVETLILEISELKHEVQLQRDEINRLKGEKGKPIIRGKRGKPDDYSSEEYRKTPVEKKPKGRVARNHKIEITREEKCSVPKEILPSDAEFKGYSTVIVQDLVIKAENIKFYLERYYSPSTGKTYSADRPAGYEGEYGPGVKSLIYGLKYSCNVSESGIEDFLLHNGIFIAKSTISRYLTKNLEEFHDEKEELTKCGLISTNFQQLDDTGARVNGEQWYTQIVCNPYYTSYTTIPHKDRLSILKLFLGPHEVQFHFNDEAFDLLKSLKVPETVITYLKKNCSELTMDEVDLNTYLLQLPTRSKSVQMMHRRIKEASGIAWYHNQTEWPIIDTLLTDDAPQFDHLACYHALCWVHAGRNLKKLNPFSPAYQEILKEILSKFWDFYHLLEEFKNNPDPTRTEAISQKFDEVFIVKTGYQALDDRIKTIVNNKDKLLQVLRNPDIPLHNNESELGARAQVRKRDVSLHTITPEGTKAVDTFLSLRETAKKCGVNFYELLRDRITKAGKIPRLGIMVLQMGKSASSLILPSPLSIENEYGTC